MEVKDRFIRVGKEDYSSAESNCVIVDAYGIEDGKIYHRHIVISEDAYEVFEKNPDEKMLLDTFLEHHDIDSEWKPYVVRIPDSNRINEDGSNWLLEHIDLGNMPGDSVVPDEQTRKAIYRELYNELSKKDTLINNPSIMDVFNEAIRENSELANWESVFPFFE